MKQWILLLSMAMTIGHASAQRIKVGPEIGINWSKFSVDDPLVDEDDLKMRGGLKIGGVVDIGFTPMFSFQPGLYFVQKGSRDRYSYPEPGGRVHVNNKIRLNYMEIPLNFQFRLGHPRRAQFFVGAGPYLAFAVGGELDERSTFRGNNGSSLVIYDDERDIEFGDDEFDDDFKGGDAGININLGVVMRRGFFIRGNTGIGLANILPEGDDDYSWKNLSLSLTVGFLFGH